MGTINTAATIPSSAGGGSGNASVPNYSVDNTISRSIVSTDLQNLLVYNSAANGTITIPNDTTLSIAGSTNASFEVFQKSTGVPTIAAGVGVTLNIWAGYPASAQYVTQTIHHVGPNTWAVK